MSICINNFLYYRVFLLLYFVAWLNNCVGYANHRYFYMYMLYTSIGSMFLILFGLEIAYHIIWLGPDEGWVEVEPLEGHPVTYNLTGHIVPMVNLLEVNH